MGLVSKCVTGPWQRLVENTPRILDLNDHFNREVDLFDKWSKDASDLIDGSAKLFDNVPVHKDPVFDSLVEPNDNDISTKYLLQNIMTAFVSVSKRQLADQLMGGVHHNPSADLLKQASSCPAHNISGERIFGQLDFNLHRAPNAAVEFVEAKIMFAENKTAQWLNEKTQFEKKCLHDSARKIARVNISKSKKQHKKLHEIKSKLLKEKQEMLAKKFENQRVLKENLLEDLQKLGGLWSSEQDLDHHLRLIKSENKRLSALKVQLKVHKIILSQKEEANLFSLSKNGKKFNSLQLQVNLQQLITLSKSERAQSQIDTEMQSILEQPNILVGKMITHCWEDSSDSMKKWFEGTISGMSVAQNIIEYILYIYIHTHKQLII